MRASPFIAVGLVIAAVAWVGSAYYGEEELAELTGNTPVPADASTSAAPQAPLTTEREELTKVRVRDSVSQTRTRALRLTGKTEADRRVKLRMETNGRVISLKADKGDLVKRGTPLIKVALNDRNARLSRAEAEVRQRELEYEAAKQLARKKFRSETNVAEAEAQLESAQADLAAIRIELGKTGVSAPFEGILEERYVELGDYLQEGDDVATIVDLDPILVVATVPEREIEAVKLGQLAHGKLVTGETVTGIISFISPAANANTRTFRVEVEIENPNRILREGITTEVALPVGNERAHFIPRSIITLADDGRIGVRAVVNGDQVRFYEVSLLGDDIEGFWVGGLPDQVTLITSGQEWVRDGAKVDTQPDPRPAPIPSLPLLSEADAG